MRHVRTPSISAERQRGIVLVMSLIFLIILSLVILYGVRGTILGEQVAKNLQANETAAQAAETALRFCENEVLSASFSPILPIQNPPQWQDISNWSDDSKSFAIPAAQLAETNMRSLPVAPRCMVEMMDLPPAAGESAESVSFLRTHLVTAVGYSADYEANGSGQGISGSEVWLQSILVH